MIVSIYYTAPITLIGAYSTKEKMFLNISNHPSEKWSDAQREAAGGNVIDIPFPNVDPMATTEEVVELGKQLCAEICAKFGYPVHHIGQERIAMVQGEATLCSELWRKLSPLGWRIVVATTERRVVENADGVKTTQFQFCQFRDLRPFEIESLA